MAAITLPKPGSEYGPCVPDCTHTDCAQTREMAARVCRFCDLPIGYDTRFYADPGNPNRDALVHALCLEKWFADEQDRLRQVVTTIGTGPDKKHP